MSFLTIQERYIKAVKERNYPDFVQCLCEGVPLASLYQGTQLLDLTLRANLPLHMQNFLIHSKAFEPHVDEGFLLANSFKPELVPQLIDKVSGIDIQNQFGLTALMLSCTNEKLENFKLLWHKNANVFIRDKGNFGVFSMSFLYNTRSNEVWEFLLDNLASARMCEELKSQLLDKGYWENFIKGKTSVHAARSYEKFQSISMRYELQKEIKAVEKKVEGEINKSESGKNHTNKLPNPYKI